MAKIKWGVIGAAGIADKRTIPEGIIPAENSELAGLMSLPGTGVEELSEKYEGVAWFTDAEEMLDAVELDACYIASPPHVHLEHVQACAERGIHILCEKPLAITVPGAEQILQVCEEAGVKLGVGLMMPFHHIAVESKRLVQEGVLGEVVSARAQFGFDYPPMAGAFRQVKELHRGGAFMDVGNHGAALLEFVIGARVESVMAMSASIVHQYRGAEDSLIAVLRFDSGALGIVDTYFSTTAAQNLLEVNGSERTLIAQGILSQTPDGVLRVVASDEGAVEHLRIISDERNVYVAEIQVFAEAVLNDTAPPIPGEEGLWSQRVVEAVYQSAESGRLVRVAEV